MGCCVKMPEIRLYDRDAAPTSAETFDIPPGWVFDNAQVRPTEICFFFKEWEEDYKKSFSWRSVCFKRETTPYKRFV